MNFNQSNRLKSPLFCWIIVAVIAVLLTLGAFWLNRPVTPDFSQYEAGAQRKKVFFDYFSPIVQSSNLAILDAREELLAMRGESAQLSFWQKRSLAKISQHYGLPDFDPASDSQWQELLRRVDVIPVSLALAQAANESAWGTSRFARQGNNFFGQWCFEPGCGIVPANRDKGKTHEVAKFNSPQQSVEGYIKNLNQHDAYQSLRSIRAQLRADQKAITGTALAAGLNKYSERGAPYIAELRQMIRVNKLDGYDHPLDVIPLVDRK